MADELIHQAGGICGEGAWWNTGLFSGSGLSSPCSAALVGGAGHGYYIGGFGSWGRSCSSNFDFEETNYNSSVCDDSSIVFPATTAADIQNPPSLPPQRQPDGGGGNGRVLMDSALQIMEFGLSPSSSTTDWNRQTLLGSNEGSDGNYNSIIQEDVDSRMNHGQARNSINTMDNNSTCIDHQTYPIDQQPLNSSNSSGDSNTTCEGSVLPAVSFPMSPLASYALIQSLLEPEDLQLPQDLPLLDNTQTLPYSSLPNSYQVNVKSVNSWQRAAPLNVQPDNSMTKAQVNNSRGSSPLNYLNTSLLSPANPIINEIRTSLLSPSSLSASKARAFEEGSRRPNILEGKEDGEKVHDKGSIVVKGDDEPAFKKPRVETPSPLPTFKVRKEKLGDRITALQQLVSPFGKTDTASVLHEAIEYIKFLHAQVSALSNQYLNNGYPTQHEQACENLSRDNNEGPKQDLVSRGLCLVPISCTYPVAHETPVDFWTPTFGAPFR